MPTETIEFSNGRSALAVYCSDEKNLEMAALRLGIRIVSRGGVIKLMGSEKGVARGLELFGELMAMVADGHTIAPEQFVAALDAVAEGRPGAAREVIGDRIEVMSRKKRYISPRTPGQRAYVEAIRGHDIVFGIGPAGTGKTYLAMAMAVSSLRSEKVSRIILVRPAIEAGETLGYLPGDLKEKVAPYLRPLYDALYDMMDIDQIQKCMDRGVIEVVPLAYMRGRTLNDSFIILDEAQNSTSEQMKMFLTRLGFDSRAVITGDITQVDLPQHKPSGLIVVQSILAGIDGISFIYFNEKDVVRHDLVQDIIRAYERNGNQGGGR
ncbi:MAG: PhoH family protein [Candidatus Tritonobacter lacicola]|nr:PhoH family protein [Candidatus Tritonobacter lacicola]